MLSEKRIIPLLSATAVIAAVFFAPVVASAQPDISDVVLLAALDTLATEMDLDRLASRLERTNANVARRLPQIGQSAGNPLKACEAQLAQAKTGLARFKVARRKPDVSDDYLAALIECYATATGELDAGPAPASPGF